MYYSSCLRGVAEQCCGAMAVGDATFIHEQLDRHLEGSLEYVMPQVRDLCHAHQQRLDAAAAAVHREQRDRDHDREREANSQAQGQQGQGQV